MAKISVRVGLGLLAAIVAVISQQASALEMSAARGGQILASNEAAIRAGGVAASRWQPSVTDTWQWQLRGKINTTYNVDVYDIDLFDTDAAVIAQLKRDGRKVVCYFSAGSSENWRTDFSQFKAWEMGRAMRGWAGENWLDVRSDNVRSIMKQRLDRAVAKGCDGVEPDNVDGYANDTGFPLTAQDQLAFNGFLAREAHARNLAIGLKNDVNQLAALEPLFDFAVNEECHEQNECRGYRAFTAKNKPVLNAEYRASYRTEAGRRELCAAALAANLRTLVLPRELDDSFRFSCD